MAKVTLMIDLPAESTDVFSDGRTKEQEKLISFFRELKHVDEKSLLAELCADLITAIEKDKIGEFSQLILQDFNFPTQRLTDPNTQQLYYYTSQPLLEVLMDNYDELGKIYAAILRNTHKQDFFLAIEKAMKSEKITEISHEKIKEDIDFAAVESALKKLRDYADILDVDSKKSSSLESQNFKAGKARDLYSLDMIATPIITTLKSKLAEATTAHPDDKNSNPLSVQETTVIKFCALAHLKWEFTKNSANNLTNLKYNQTDAPLRAIFSVLLALTVIGPFLKYGIEKYIQESPSPQFTFGLFQSKTEDRLDAVVDAVDTNLKKQKPSSCSGGG